MNAPLSLKLIDERSGISYSCRATREDADSWTNLGGIRVVGLEYEAYAWPGGYEISYITKDGGVLCHGCANENLELTLTDPMDAQWHIIAADIHYEGDPLTCDHCGRIINPEYGYGDDDE